MFSPDLGRSSLFQGLSWLDQVARLLEKVTYHPTRRLQLWDSETHRRPPLLESDGFGSGGFELDGFVRSQLGMDSPTKTDQYSNEMDSNLLCKTASFW